MQQLPIPAINNINLLAKPMTTSEICSAIFTLPLLFVITMVNTEYIFQNNFLQIYALIFLIYLVVAWLGLLFFKRFQITNTRVKKELRSTLQFIFYMCILVLPGVWMTHYFILSTLGGTGLYLRAYGKVAFVYLVLALSVSPFLTFIPNKKISEILISMRKVLWILSFIFFLKHGLEYFSMEYLFAIKHSPAISYGSYLRQNFIIRRDASTGVIAGVLLFILGITSNNFSMKVLNGNVWKKVQSLVYPAFLIVAIHVACASRFDMFYVALTLWLVFIRTSSYLANKDKPKDWPTTKYICIPCGYIYDEAVGDPDGGLEPGTKFADIPDSRVCPICGVTKLSFEPYYETQNSVFTGYMAQIINYIMLTKDVLELTLKVNSKLTILPGQYVQLILKDFDGEFTRSYSIVEHTDNTIKLWIKVSDTWRWGRTLKKLKNWDPIKRKWVYGSFVLKKTANPKIFIGTWTGLSPLFNMMASNSYSVDNTLFFWASTQADLFYVDQLKNIKNLKTEFFISKEEVKGYHYGRIDTSKYEFPINTEFYLCGNPPMVAEQMKQLKARWYENVYSEAF